VTQTPSVQAQAQAPQARRSPVEEARARLQEVERILNTAIIGHENMTKAILLATVAKEHVIVIGPPGTAKSYAIRLLSKSLNARFYSYLLTKFTTYDELFGTIDISALSKGEYKRNWSRIVTSDFVFLDEIFKANSAILNALLSLLQERIVYDPMSGQEVPTQLWTAVGASNETPDDELQALFDRFAIRVFVDYLDDDRALLNAIVARWINNNNIQQPVAIATMNDVRVLHDYAISLIPARIKDLGSEIYKLYHVNVLPVVKSMRSKGIIVSDRTIIEKLPKIYAAYLALYGVTADNTMNAGYDILLFTARTRDELRDIKKLIDDMLGEVAELAKKLERAKEQIKARNLSSAKEVLKEILNYDVSRISKTPWLRPRVEAIIATARQYIDYIAQVEQLLDQMAKTRE